MPFRCLFLTFICLSVPVVRGADAIVPAGVKPALDQISARSLRGHLTFLSSDLLEGRNTPSRGLDIAAEYIAAQFQRIGLEPAASGGSYFQVAQYVQEEADLTGFQMSVTSGAETTALHATDVSLQGGTAVDVADAVVVKAATGAPKADEVKGKIVMLRMARGDASARRGFAQLLRRVQEMKPLGIVIVADGDGPSRGTRSMPRLRLAAEQTALAPVVTVRSKALAKVIEEAEPATVSLHIAAAKQTAAPVRNVAGILRGSDPKLKETFLLVTAHYDHVGMADSGDDRIYNGANDDGSGTVSVIEIADALSRLPQHPKRSILFMTYFGEEKGLLGSRYFGQHPLVALKSIVGDINLEQMGRTDSPEGSHAGLLQVTGRSFSDVVQTLAQAGSAMGVHIDENDKDSDAFFSRSDNQALADQGIPAHTVCVAYEFPDYHKVGDSAEKVDYENMAKADRTVALAVWLMSEKAQPPHWNESNPKAAKYVEAYRKLHPAPAAAAATSPAQE